MRVNHKRSHKVVDTSRILLLKAIENRMKRMDELNFIVSQLLNHISMYISNAENENKTEMTAIRDYLVEWLPNIETWPIINQPGFIKTSFLLRKIVDLLNDVKESASNISRETDSIYETLKCEKMSHFVEQTLMNCRFLVEPGNIPVVSPSLSEESDESEESVEASVSSSGYVTKD